MNVDDPGTRAIRHAIERPIVTCGLDDPSVDLFAEMITESAQRVDFRLRLQGNPVGVVRLGVGGRHNAQNALLALGAGWVMGADLERRLGDLERFEGVRRRFEFRGQAGGVRVYDDYAHHPREIEATLAVAARLREEQGGRIIAVFQPHRYTRTEALAEAFGTCFAEADLAVLTDVYAAGDKPIPGVSGERIFEAVQRAGRPEALYCAALDEVAALLAPRLRAGDVVLTLGAGDVTTLAEVILGAVGLQAP
jgi:UDP-N-acetylmuramate--alanine ligase